MGTADDGRPPEVLSSGSDELGFDEEVLAAVESSAVSAWLGAHRLILLVGGCLAVVVVAGAHQFLTRPPAPDPVVRVSYVPLQGTQSGAFIVDALGRPRASSAYVVNTRVAGDVDALVGVIGPGLVDPTSSITRVTSTHPGIGSIGATVSCADPRWWSAKDSDYRIPVRRTDQYGRVTTSDTPMDATTATHWHGFIRQTCLGAFFRTLPAALALPIPAIRPQEVDFIVVLTNLSTHALWVLGATYTDGATVTFPLVSSTWTSLTDAPWTSLPAGGSASVEMSIQVGECVGGPPHVPFARTATGQVEHVEAVPLLVAQSLHPLEGHNGASWAALAPASAARLDAEVAAVCPRPGR